MIAIHSRIKDPNGVLILYSEIATVNISPNNILSQNIYGSANQFESYKTIAGSEMTITFSNLTKEVSWKLFHFIQDIGRVFVSCHLGLYDCYIKNYSEKNNQGTLSLLIIEK